MTDMVLRLKLTADGSGVVQAVGGAVVAVKRLGDEAWRVDSEAARLNSSLGNLSRGFGSLGSVIASVGFGALVKQVLDYADNLKNLSAELGITTTSLQEMRHFAAQSGMSLDDLTGMVRKLSKTITDAAQGQKEAAETLNKLGLSAEKLQKIPLDVALEKVGERLLTLNTTTEQNAAAVDALGKGGLKWIGVMRDQETALIDVRKEAHQLGLVMSTETVDALDRLGDQAGETLQAWKVWIGESVAAIEGPLMDALRAFGAIPDWLKSRWADFWDWFGAQARSHATVGMAAENEEMIRNLERMSTQARDRIGMLAQAANEQHREIGVYARQEMDDLAKKIGMYEQEIAIRKQDFTVIQNVGNAQAEASRNHRRESELKRQADIDLATARDRVNVAGQNAIKTTGEHAAKMSEAEKAAKAFAIELERVLDAVNPANKVMGDLAHQMSVLNQALAQGDMGWNAYAEATLDATEIADKALNKDLVREAEKAAKEQERQAKAFEDAWRRSVERVDDFFVDLWKGVLSGTSSFVETIKNLFIGMLAELAHAAITRPTMLNIMTSLGMPAAAGTAAQAGSMMSTMGGYANMLGMGAQMAGINPVPYLNWLGTASGLQYGTGFGSQQSLMLAGQESGMTGFGWGGILPFAGAALGGWGLGGMAAGWYGGNTLGGNIGGALGGMGGMFAAPAIAGALGLGGAASGALMGSVVPVIGTIVGAILGGLLGGLFGGDKEPNHFRVSLGTNKSFPYRGTIKGYEDYTSVQGPFGDVGYILRGNNDAFDAAAESSEKFLEGIAQIDQAFAQFLNPQEVAAVKDRLKNLSEVEFTDTFSGIKAIKQRLGEMLDAVDPRLKALYDGLDITADNAGTFAIALLGLRKEMGALDTQIRALSSTNNPVQQFLDNIGALDAAMMSAAKAGQEALAAGDPQKVLEAEQALKQSIVARYQYEMDAATQLNGVIEGLKASIAQLKAQAYQIAVGRYRDWLDINQRINATGGGGVAQLDIYRSAGAELLGAYGAETDPARRLEMLRQGVEVVDQGLALALSDIDKWVQEQQAARQVQIDALNKEKAAIQEAAQTRLDALNQELQVAQQWAGILSQAQSSIDQLQYGGQNPLSAFARLGFARSDLAGETDPSRRLQLLQTIMGLGGEAYQRPSAAYGSIYNEVIRGMTGLRNEASREAGRAMQIQEDIASTNQDMAAKLANIDKQIAALQDMSDIQRAAADMQAQARSEAATYYTWIQREGARAYDELAAANAAQTQAAKDALAIAQGQMDALTAGLGYQAFIAQRQAEMAAILAQIRDVLAGIYGGSMSPAQVAQISPDQIRAMVPIIRAEIMARYGKAA